MTIVKHRDWLAGSALEYVEAAMVTFGHRLLVVDPSGATT